MLEVSCEDHGDVVILAIEGGIQIESVEYMEKIWNEQVAKKPKVVAINCKNITFMDSSAIGMLVKFLDYAMKLKIELIFYDLSEIIFDIFKTAKLQNFFNIMQKKQFELKYLD